MTIENTLQTFHKLGISKNPIPQEKLNDLDNNGFCLFKPDKKIFSFLGKDLNYFKNCIDKLLKKEAEKAGYEGREEHYKEGKKFEPIASRLGNLPNKDNSFLNFVLLPELLWSAFYIIKKDIMFSSSNFREPLIGSKQQRLHIDWLPRFKHSENYDCVIAMLYLDDSNSDNGAIKVVPGSHKRLGYPDQYCNPYDEHPDSISIEAEAGSIIIVNSNLWHRGGPNISGKRRRIINAVYRNRELKQGLNQYVYINDVLKNKMKEEEKYLFKIRDVDNKQKEKIFGPGNEYREWLVRNPKFNYSKSKDITIKHI